MQFHCHLSDGIYQDNSTNTTNIFIFIHFLLSKRYIALFLKTMWDHTDDCANNYCCVSNTYLLSCIFLELYINVDRYVCSPGYIKGVVSGINAS